MLSLWRPLLAIALLAMPLVPLAFSARIAPTNLPLWRTLALQACWCGLAWLTALGLGGSPRERLGLTRVRLGATPLLACVLATLALSGALNFALEQLALRSQGSLARLDAITAAAAPHSPWLALLAFGIAPGIGEELLFRGLLQRALAPRFGAWSIALAAAAFGLLHQDPVHSPAAFALGCALGAVAWLARSTWAAVLCHVVNNCAATLQQLGAASVFPRPESWLDGAVWLATSGLALAVVARSAARHRSPTSSSSG